MFLLFVLLSIVDVLFVGRSQMLPVVQTSESMTLECRISRSTIHFTPWRSWQALPPGTNKPLGSLASTGPLPGDRQALHLPLRACQISTAETCFLLVYLARKGIAPFHPTRPAGPAHTSTGAARARGLQQRDEQVGKVHVGWPYCSPLGILWGSTPQSCPQTHPSPDDGGELKLDQKLLMKTHHLNQAKKISINFNLAMYRRFNSWYKIHGRKYRKCWA